MTQRQLAKLPPGWKSFFLANPDFATLKPKASVPLAANDEGGTIDFGRAAITRRLLTVERRLDTYYARHRASKGDTSETAEDTVTVVGDAAWLREIAGVPVDGTHDHELWQRCVALCSALGVEELGGAQ